MFRELSRRPGSGANQADIPRPRRSWRLPLCLLGFHRRLGRSVLANDDGYRADCRGCGRSMLRTFDGRWRMARRRER